MSFLNYFDLKAEDLYFVPNQDFQYHKFFPLNCQVTLYIIFTKIIYNIKMSSPKSNQKLYNLIRGKNDKPSSKPKSKINKKKKLNFKCPKIYQLKITILFLNIT